LIVDAGTEELDDLDLGEQGSRRADALAEGRRVLGDDEDADMAEKGGFEFADGVVVLRPGC
jgi:hypothetical protein